MGIFCVQQSQKPQAMLTVQAARALQTCSRLHAMEYFYWPDETRHARALIVELSTPRFFGTQFGVRVSTKRPKSRFLNSDSSFGEVK